MDTLKNTANYVSDKMKSATSGASKEANKEVAKDSSAGLGSRWVNPLTYQFCIYEITDSTMCSLQATGDMISDKAKETKHSASAEANKEAAKH